MNALWEERKQQLATNTVLSSHHAPPAESESETLLSAAAVPGSTSADPEIQAMNCRIQNEICRHTIAALEDSNLLDEYKSSNSVKAELEKLQKVLIQNQIEPLNTEGILRDYLMEIIPAGTKGSIRGNHFNRIVKECILSWNLNPHRFQVKFETPHVSTNEIPDWIIEDISILPPRTMIGMNQLDLWKGGAQTNRGSKYIQNFENTNDVNLVCVICNDIQFTSKKNKTFQLLKTGFQKNTLCYLPKLKSIVSAFFKM
jgi:hypothetical protein